MTKNVRYLLNAKICYLTISMMFPHSLLAQSIPVLIHPGIQTQDQILFRLTSEEPAAIFEVRMHFLSGADCYSGYMQGYRMATELPFLLKKDQPFALTGEGIYRIAQTVLPSDYLSDIHGLLIRFLDDAHGQRYQQFARFTGSCQDQGINCCIPIDCSVTAGVCLAKYDLGIQSIRWERTFPIKTYDLLGQGPQPTSY